MPTLSRPLDPRHGATVWIKVMQSPEYVDALKKAGLRYATPISVIGILDTGANVSALDSQVIRGMSLLRQPRVLRPDRPGHPVPLRPHL